MNERLKDAIKKVLGRLPISFTQNQRYDRETEAVIRRVCRRDSCCIDVGTHRGEILDLMRDAAPDGTHFGFEPLPHLYDALTKRYAGVAGVELSPYALADEVGTASFNHVKTNPAYSGLQKRRYDRPEEDETITVQVSTLDDVVLPHGKKIDLLKIDVEGGEMGVLRGASALLRRDHPVVIFEFGKGGSDIYGTTPEMLYELFDGLGYHVTLMSRYLAGQPPFTLEELRDQFQEERNYYFLAH